MLKFILGTAGSGKTYSIISEIKKLTDEGKSGIFLLVPEQYSFECEKLLLNSLGVKAANRVNVVTFTKLCREILSSTGGLSARIADEGVRLILMGQALESLKDKLTVYTSFSSSHGFAAKLMKDITELKQAAVTPEILSRCADEVSSAGLREKLKDISLIMESYDTYIKGKFIDPEDMPTVAAEKAAEAAWFRDKYIFFDGFTGFTHSQYLIIESAIRNAAEIAFSFTVENENKTETDIFSNIRKEIRLIREIASKYGIKENSLPPLTKSYSAEGISKLDLCLRNKAVTPAENNSVHIAECETKDDEAEFCAAEIRRRVRQEGARWRDFIIITGSGADYENTVEKAMKKHNVPIFISKKTLMCDLPLARFVTAALEVVKNKYRTEDVLKYLKSGLCTLSEDEVDQLENYIYVWNIKGDTWKRNWDMNPAGLYETKENPEFTAEKLNQLNRMRISIISPLEKFENSIDNTAEKTVAALFNLIQECKVKESLKNYSDWQRAEGNYQSASLSAGSWDSLIAILDRITYCYSDIPLTFQSFCDLIETSFNTQSVGQIPQRTDEVIFGTAERIRPMRPKNVFILGANYGVFPSSVSNNGLFSLSEREEMTKAGASLPDRYLGAVCEQEYFFYTSAVAASNSVYITYRTKNKGAEMKPSLQVKRVAEKLKIQKVKYTQNSINPQNAESVESLFSFLAANFNEGGQTVATFKEFLSQDDEYKTKVEKLGKGIEQTERYINGDIAKKLYDKNMYISPSRVEKYYSCPFSYFCQYGLGLTKLKKAEVNSQIRGTVTHYVLENILKKYKDNLGALDEKKAAEEIEHYIKEYFCEVKVDITTIDTPSKIALKAVEEGLLETVLSLKEEFLQSKFYPTGFEVPIGKKEWVDPPEIEGDGCSVKFVGSVDRVDLGALETGEKYVRIIDYKTGAKKFTLSDVYQGVNMQMLLYLMSITEDKKKTFGEVIPAGILYDSPLPSASENGFSPVRNGILTSDILPLSMMEEDIQGKYIPAKLKKDGSLSALSSVTDQENFEVIFKFIKKKTVEMAENLLDGYIEAKPVKTKTTDGCKYCEMRAVCGKESNDNENVTEIQDNVIEMMKNEVENNGR